MRGLGRSAALLGLSGVAGMVLAFGPGASIAMAVNDGGKDGVNSKDDGGLFPNGILGDKNKDCNKDKDGGILGDKNKDGKDGKDDGGLFPNGILDDKDKDRNCGVGVGVGGVGVGVGGGGGAGVAAGGGGMSDPSTALPIAGAGLGAVLLTVGYATRRRQQHNAL